MIDEHGKKVIILVASLSSFLVPYSGSSITVALPAMAVQFNVDAVTLGWITSATSFLPCFLSCRSAG